MRKIKAWIAAHTVITAVACTLVFSGAAFAAWIIYSGANGSSSTSFSTAGTVDAITFGAASSGVEVTPCTAGVGASCTGGSPGKIQLTLTNNDSSAPHGVTDGSLTNAPYSGITLSTPSAPACASHLFITSVVNLDQVLGAGGSAANGEINLVADPSTPPALCSAVPITATIHAATS